MFITAGIRYIAARSVSSKKMSVDESFLVSIQKSINVKLQRTLNRNGCRNGMYSPGRYGSRQYN